MAGNESALQELLKTVRQVDEEGVFQKIQKSLQESSGFIEQFDSSVSALNGSLKALQGLKVFFGPMVETQINFNEELARSTSYNKEFLNSLDKTRDQIMSLGAATSTYGVKNSENLKTLQQFSRESIKLLPIYKENAKALVENAAKMKAFGIETSESVALITKLATSLDMTGDQLSKTRMQLVSFAQQTGQSVKEVMTSYKSSIGNFMDFLNPEEMNKSFMQFQVMARRMGSDANSLYEMATKFDTIEGAQETGSRLNQTFSALGIEFNSLALQEMEPDERIRYVSQKVKEGLDTAKTMGGREGRLIMRSLREAGGFGSFEQLRAFAAEGGRIGSTDFERGGLQEMGYGAETELARRTNFYAVGGAEAEQRVVANMEMSAAFKSLRPVIHDFGRYVLDLEEGLRPFKQGVSTMLFKGLESQAGGAIQTFANVLTLQQQIDDRSKEFLRNMGIQNVTTIKDVVDAMGRKNQQDINNMLAGLATIIGRNAGAYAQNFNAQSGGGTPTSSSPATGAVPGMVQCRNGVYVLPGTACPP